MEPSADNEFCKLVQSYSPSTLTFANVKEALLVLDPRALDGLSLFSKIVLTLSFSKINSRKSYLLPYFLREKKRIEGRPESMVAAFHALFLMTFPESNAAAKEKLTSEELHKKKAALLEKAKLFTDLNDEITRASSEESIQIIEKTLSERLNQLHQINQKVISLTANIKKLSFNIPAIFLKDEHRSSKQKLWDEIRNSLLQPIVIQPKAPFQDQASFTSYIEENTNTLKKLELYYWIYRQSAPVADELKELLTNTAGCYQPLYDRCSIKFISFIEDALLEGAPNLIETIQKQQEAVIRTNKMIQGFYSELKRKSIPIFNEFLGPVLRAYPDLFKTANSIADRPDPSTVEGYILLNEEVEKNIGLRVSNYTHTLFEDIKSLLQKGYIRNQKIEDIERFQKKYRHMLTPLQSYLDLKEAYEEQEKIAESLSIKRHLLAQLSSEQLDETINHQHEKLKELVKKSSALFVHLLTKVTLLEISAENAKHTIKQRLFEIFTETTPFPDLLPKIKEVHKQLKNQIIEYDSSFYNGQMLLLEYQNKIAELAYDHDVVLLRNELSFRAGRMRELRESCRNNLLLIQLYRRLLDLCLVSNTETVYRNALSFESELKSTLKHIEDPFKIFSSCLAPESVHSTFKRLWLQLEENKLQAESLKQECTKHLQTRRDNLKKALLFAADDLEEVLKSPEGARPQLFTLLQKLITECPKDKELEVLLKYISDLEKNYPMIKPFTFFLQIQDQKIRREYLTEVKHVYNRISISQAFAKNMQYIKTFEEERVDDILEAFEHLGIIEEENGEFLSCKAGFTAYKTRMHHSIRLVEEEVFLDIGLLDNKAIQNSNEREFKKLIKHAIAKAKKHLLEVPGGTNIQLETLKAQYSKKSFSEKTLCHLIDDITLWTTKKISEEHSTAFLLEELSLFCRLLFLSRAFIFAERGNISAIKAKILFEITFIIHELELFLRNCRQSSTKELEAEIYFIQECHALRKKLQKIEAESEDPSLLKPFLDDFFNTIALIPEIKRLPAPTNFDLTELRTELYSQLEALSIKKEGNRPHLFHYIPGCLTYFG